MKLSALAQPRFSSMYAEAHSPAGAVMSPVNQNGCFEFDRIIKAGSVLKRTRKTKVLPTIASSSSSSSSSND
jgi:hypothetical protein